MEVYLVEFAKGIVALEENGDIIGYREYTNPVKAILSLENGIPDEAHYRLVEEVMDKRPEVIVLEDEELVRRLREKFPDLRFEARLGNHVAAAFRSNITTYLEKLGLKPSEYKILLHKTGVELTKEKVREAAEKRDLFIAQAINALDEINKTLNLFSSRLREWYGLHFPELDEIIDEHEDYAKIVYFIGLRDKISREALEKIGIDGKAAVEIEKAAKGSMGASITEFDWHALRTLAGNTLELFETRRYLEKYIDEAMKDVAPNIRGIVGPLLGARLIALAGGLSKLAILPASTIQVLGAEKALFRALRTGTRPPKHGVIFQFPAIHKAPRWQRGKIARSLAAKLAIAARIDAFTGEYRADELREELDKRIEEIKTKYAKPPVRKPAPTAPKEGRRRGRRRRGRRRRR